MEAIVVSEELTELINERQKHGVKDYTSSKMPDMIIPDKFVASYQPCFIDGAEVLSMTKKYCPNCGRKMTFNFITLQTFN